MQDRKKIQQAYEEYGTIEKAAEALGIARSTFHYHLNKNKSDDYTLDPLPDSDIPIDDIVDHHQPQTHPTCLLYTSPSPRDGLLSRMPSSA